MKSNLYIPSKIHVGFQNREDTYTGKLAYVVYEDEKGVLRKKDSWDGWRDKNIDVQVFDNKPAKFVFNKGVQRYGYFGSGRSVMRVYDARDFEFEISIDNLVGILMHSDISKRDIVEECVFAWSGKDLVLLPVNSEEYQNSLEYTKKQALKISTKDLQVGFIYEKKKSDEQLMYIGYYDFFDFGYGIHSYSGKKHIFYDITHNRFVTPGVNTLAQSISSETSKDYAEVLEMFQESIYSSEIKNVLVKNKKMKSEINTYRYLYKIEDNCLKKIQYFINSNSKIEQNVYYNEGLFKKENKKMICNIFHFESSQLIKIYDQAGIQYKIKKGHFNYYSIEIDSLSFKEFEDKLKAIGFGNTLVAIDVNGKEKEGLAY